MKKIFSGYRFAMGVFVLAAMPLVCLTTSCGGNKNAKVFDKGKLDGNTYSNSYFDFSVDVPQGWYVFNRYELEQASKESANAIPNKAVRQELERTMELESVPLLVAYQSEPGTVKEFIPSFQAVAENLRWLPDVKTGEHYLMQALETFRVSGMQYESLDVPVNAVKIDGEEFYTIKLRVNYGEYMVTQEWYSTVRDGFALNFGFTYDGDNDKHAGEMAAIRESIVFSPKTK